MASPRESSLFNQGPDNTSCQYEPMKEDEIRIVRFRPNATRDDLRLKTEHRQRESELQYYALSYCWGDAAAQKQIVLDDRPFMITESLYEALSALLAWLGPSHAYWIDAICINQHDVEERNSQVQQMWRIFSGALRVLSWLGPNDHDTEALFDAWKQAGNGADGVDRALIERGMEFILSRPYFTRTWVIPEVLHARKIIMVCGSSYFPRRAMQTWLGTISDNLWNDHAALLSSHFRRFTSLKEPERLYSSQFDLIVKDYAYSACSDPRDRIFAMLSDPRAIALRPTLWLKVDYSMTTAHLWLVVMRQFTEINLRHDWRELSKTCRAFEAVLADALGVAHRSEGFGAWLAPQIGASWRPYDCDSSVAMLKSGGVIMVSSEIHPVTWTLLNCGEAVTKDASGTES